MEARQVCRPAVAEGASHEATGPRPDDYIPLPPRRPSLACLRNSGREQLGHASVPALVCGVLERFADDVALQLKGLTAVEQLVNLDAGNILLLEWSKAGLLVCKAIRKFSLTRDILVRHGRGEAAASMLDSAVTTGVTGLGLG